MSKSRKKGSFRLLLIAAAAVLTLQTYHTLQSLRFGPIDPLTAVFGGVKARAFEPWQGAKPPCFPPDPQWFLPATHRTPARKGLFMVKEMKVGGSTAAGIHLRIARNEARRQGLAEHHKVCKVRNDHYPASFLQYGKRDRADSYLWTVIRDPTKRAISQFFHFEVSRKKVEPTDTNFQKWISGYNFLNRYYLRTLSTEDVFNNVLTTKRSPVELANRIMMDYDFIGVSERMDESAVALQLLLGLKTGDILYLSAKGSGGYDDLCVYIQPSFVSEGMNEFFKTPAWRERVATDELLHRAVNKSLDMTIERLGRKQFNLALQRFRYAMQHAEEKCRSNATFPCDRYGNATRPKERDCLWIDSGCGTPCLDLVADELNLYN